MNDDMNHASLIEEIQSQLAPLVRKYGKEAFREAAEWVWSKDGKWVNAAETSPPTVGPVLALKTFLNEESIWVDPYYDIDECFCFNDGVGVWSGTGKVLYWMPLPEAPGSTPGLPI